MLKIAVATCLFLAPISALAKPVTYECQVNGKFGRGWISEKARYVIDEEAGTATAYDGLIQFMNKKPRKVALKKRTLRGYVLTWQVGDAPAIRYSRGPGSTSREGAKTIASPEFRDVLDSGNGPVTVRVHVELHPMQYLRGKGRCKESS